MGTTPIAYSLQQVQQDLRDAPGKTVVILVTDGKEECKGDLPEAAEELKRAGLQILVHVVGYDIADSKTKQMLARVAEITGGTYYDGEGAGGLGEAILQAMAAPYEVVDSTGEKVAEGLVGGEAVDVPEGVYDVLVRSTPEVRVKKVHVALERTTQVALKKEGQEVAHSVSAL